LRAPSPHPPLGQDGHVVAIKGVFDEVEDG
jgi:hypothetical protein